MHKKITTVLAFLSLCACTPGTRPDVGPSARFLQGEEAGRLVTQLALPNAALCRHFLAGARAEVRNQSHCSQTDRSAELPWSATMTDHTATRFVFRSATYEGCSRFYRAAQNPGVTWPEVCMERPA